jgi:hypothetical protein
MAGAVGGGVGWGGVGWGGMGWGVRTTDSPCFLLAISALVLPTNAVEICVCLEDATETAEVYEPMVTALYNRALVKSHSKVVVPESTTACDRDCGGAGGRTIEIGSGIETAPATRPRPRLLPGRTPAYRCGRGGRAPVRAAPESPVVLCL